MNKKYAALFNQVVQEHETQSTIHKNSKVLLVDGLNVFLRAFSANPALNANGEPVGGYYGFLLSLRNSIKLHNPSRVIIVFDGKGGSQKRKKLYAGYKQGKAIKKKLNRAIELTDNEEQHSLRLQFIKLLEYLDNLPVTVLSYDNVEADDVIAYIAKNLCNYKVIIYSNDRDYFQLIDDNISVYFPAKTKTYTKESIIEDYNILPENFIYYKVLMGDVSDNIKGYKGIGKGKFNAHFTFLNTAIFTLDQFIDFCSVSDNKYHKKISEDVDLLKRNYYIMQLLDVDISGDTKSKIREIFNAPINEFNRYQLKKMMAEDLLNGLIINFETWISNTFDKLNVLRNKND
jgi:DNA polymerase-1